MAACVRRRDQVLEPARRHCGVPSRPCCCPPLLYFSYPLSQTCVERTFNLLKKMARDERLSMKDAGVRNELFLRAHKRRMSKMLAQVMAQCPVPK